MDIASSTDKMERPVPETEVGALLVLYLLHSCCFVARARLYPFHVPSTPSTSVNGAISAVLSSAILDYMGWHAEVQCSSVPRVTFRINHTLTQALPNVLVSD